MCLSDKRPTHLARLKFLAALVFSSLCFAAPVPGVAGGNSGQSEGAPADVPTAAHDAANQRAEGSNRPAQQSTTQLALQLGESKAFICAFVLERGGSVALRGEKEKSFCPVPVEGKVLSPDEGSIVVVLHAADYVSAMTRQGGELPRLSLSGTGLDDAAVLAGRETSDTEVALTFRIVHTDTDSSRSIWSGIYQRNGFKALTPLKVTVGWRSVPDYFHSPGGEAVPGSLQLATDWRVAVAAVLGALVLGGFVVALLHSDMFRVGPMLKGEGERQASSSAEPQPKVKGTGQASPDTGGVEFLLRQKPKGVRQAYSFARVQWGLWMTFAVAAAIYLWTVVGAFPALSGSVLQLAGVSTLAATTSFFMDASNPPASEPSTSLLVDLLSGSGDATAQAHRFQALVVNVVLLLAASYGVYEHLTYPVFDASWLTMLGLSDAGQLVGKQLLEKKAGVNESHKTTGAGNDGSSVTNEPTKSLPIATLPKPPVIQVLPPPILPAAPSL